MTTAITRDRRSISQILFSRKREVDNWPNLKGGQDIPYPARRNPNRSGSLSAMLCKACVAALKGDVHNISILAPPGDVMVQSRSQRRRQTYQSYLLGNETSLLLGKVTYLLGLLFLGEALVYPDQAVDLLDALEEVLEYREREPIPDAGYDRLLLHLSDELYYWCRYREGAPAKALDRLETLVVTEAGAPLAVPVLREIDPLALTDLTALRELRRRVGTPTPIIEPATPYPGAQFRGPELGELVESLELGMHCLLVGPTATGKSLCANEAFCFTSTGRLVFTIEGHESLREFDLLGGYTPDDADKFRWNDGLLVRAMRCGGFLFVDEANRMPTRTLNVLLGVLSRGTVVLTEHGSEEVRSQEGFQVVMAMNLGQAYAVNILDRALLDRFPCVLEFHYLGARDEEDLLVAETGIDRKVATVMVKVANETRQLRRNRELSAELTPRGLFAWSRKFQAKGGGLLDRLQDSASTTWLYQVAGFDQDGYIREEASGSLLSLIDAHTAK